MNEWHKGACEFCQAGESTPVDVITAEQQGVGFDPATGKSKTAEMCRVCYELGAYYVKDSMEPLRFDQFSRGVRLVLAALGKESPK